MIILKINYNLFELALDNIGCISIVDKDCNYVYISEIWSNIFDIDREEAIGRYASDFMHDANIEDVLITGRAIIYDTECKDNDIIYAAYIPLIKDDIVCGVLIYREIKGMDNVLEFRKRTLNNHNENQAAYIDANSAKNIKNLINFEDLKLKEKQDILIKKTIVEALKKSKGNKAHAARILGISRTVIYDKLKKYDLM